MQRLEPTSDTWRAWRGHLAGQGTTTALAAGRLAPGAARPAGRWSGPALLPLGLLEGRFASGPGASAGASPVRTGTLALDDDGLHWAPSDGGAPTSLAWGEVASAEVVRAWWRSRAGLRLVCRDRAEIWFDAPDAEGIEKALDAVAAG